MPMKGALAGRKPVIKLSGENIQFCKENKYLGIIVDKNLNFIEHAKHLRKKIQKFAMALKRITKEEWGIKYHTTTILYKAVVVPIITYGATVWFDKVEKAMVRRHILAAQRSIHS